MPRLDRRRVARRPEDPLGDTNTDPRLNTRVTPERTARGTTEGARQLAQSLGRIDRVAQTKAAGVVERENAKERRRLEAAATKAAIQDDYAGRDLEQAQQSAQFGDETYQQAYLKTHYGLEARDELDRMRQHVIDQRNEPGFDANAYIDDHVAGLVDGLEDDTAINAMLPRLLHESEDIKADARQSAIESQLTRTRTQYNAFVRDQVDTGTTDTREGIELVRKRAIESNINADAADEMIVSAVTSRAVVQGQPELLDGLAEDNASGVSLADNPSFTDDIADARAQAAANRAERQAHGNFEARIALEDSAAGGSLGLSTIQQNVSRGVISEAQGISLYRRSRSARRSQAQSTNYAAMFAQGQLYQADGYATSKEVQGGIDQARVGMIAQAEANGGTAQDGLRNWLHAYRDNGAGIGSTWLKNQFSHGYSQRNSEGTPTDGFRRAAALYSMASRMRGGDKLLAKNMSDDQIAFFEKYTRNHETMDADRAFAATVEQGQGGGSLAGVTNTQSWRGGIDDVVSNLSSVDESWAPTGNTDIQNPAYARREVERQARQLVADDIATADEAPAIAERQFRSNHSVVKGAWVRTGNNPLPDNVDAQIDQQIDQLMPQIKASIGEDIEPAERAAPVMSADGLRVIDSGEPEDNDQAVRDALQFIPDPQHPRRLRVVYGATGKPINVRDEQGRRRILSINLNRATATP